MKRLVRLAAVLTAGATLMVATVGVAAAKEVSNEKYAKQVCGKLSSFLDLVGAREESTSTDPATYQQETLDSVDELIADLEATRAKLKKLSPEDGGKAVTKRINKYLTEYIDGFQEARDEFAAADPTNVAFQADVTTLSVSLSTLDATVADPFSDLNEYQDLVGAFGDEKSCEEIVTVVGG